MFQFLEDVNVERRKMPLCAQSHHELRRNGLLFKDGFPSVTPEPNPASDSAPGAIVLLLAATLPSVTV